MIKKSVILAAGLLSFSAIATDFKGYELIDGSVKKGGVSNIYVDFKNCSLSQNGHKTTTPDNVFYCDNNREVVFFFVDTNCSAITHYYKHKNGSITTSQMRVNCKSYIDAGWSAGFVMKSK